MRRVRKKPPRRLADRIAVRSGEFVQLRRRLLSRTWLWAAVLVLACVVLVVPRREARYPALRAGTVASVDIVVDKDVTVPDPESTEEKRRRASQEVLPVYIYDPAVAVKVSNSLERLFAAAREGAPGTPSELAARLGDVSGLPIQPQEAEALHQIGFSGDLLNVLLDLVNGLYRQGIAADRLELLQSADRGVAIREPSGKERVELDVYRFIDASSGLLDTIEQRLAAEPVVPRRSRATVAAFLARAIPPNITLDRGETLARRIKAAASVEEVSIHLARGRVLVRRGDEITPQTERLLAALAVGRESSYLLGQSAGVFLIAALLAGALFFFLKREGPTKEEARSRFGALVVLTVLVLALERALAFVAQSVAASIMRDPVSTASVVLAALPHATGPILAGLMFGLPVALLFAAIQCILISLMLAGDVNLSVFALAAGTAGAFASERLKERNVFARVAVVVATVNALAIVGLTLWKGRAVEGNMLVAEVTAGIVGALLSAALASFILPVLESATGSITDIRLLELSNPNLPLLKRLALEAPGTFQHSLAMANLAEAAAEAVGANPLLARVCCYYHDIGKLAKPEYFVENQRGENPHDHLSPWMSSLVVSNHVKAGLELARQYRLPEPIREAISTHHGTKLIRYFFSRAKEQETEDTGQVQETEFRYQGPRPHSKEMGILLLADVVEAAARTLQDPTPGKIQGMIDQVIKNVLEDHQLDECDLTLKDIERIEATFFWVLTNAFHHRVDYPGFDFNSRRG